MRTVLKLPPLHGNSHKAQHSAQLSVIRRICGGGLVPPRFERFAQPKLINQDTLCECAPECPDPSFVLLTFVNGSRSIALLRSRAATLQELLADVAVWMSLGGTKQDYVLSTPLLRLRTSSYMVWSEGHYVDQETAKSAGLFPGQ